MAARKPAVSKNAVQASIEKLRWLRIGDGTELQGFLEKTFNAPVVYDLLRRKEKLDREAWVTLQLEGIDCPLSEEYGGTLYRVCREVLAKLGLTELNVEFFVTQASDVNAYAYYSHVEEKPHAITLTSELVERLSLDAVRKVIGHELAHLLFGQAVLTEAIRSVYPNPENMPPFLKGVFDYWHQVSEMTADRMGLFAAGALEPAIEAMFCFSTGLSLGRLDLGYRDYLKLANRQIKRIRKNEGLYSQSHPIPAMRIKALSIFHDSMLWKDCLAGKKPRPDAALERRMGKILAIMKKSPSQDVGRASLDFLASAGSLVMMADREVPAEEFDNLVDTLSSFSFWPAWRIREFLGGPRKIAAAKKLMKSSSAWLERHAPEDRVGLFDSLVNVMLRDRVVDDREVEVLRDIGMNHLKLSESVVAGRMLQGIQDRFVPLRG
jgi:hypothetical protein